LKKNKTYQLLIINLYNIINKNEKYIFHN